MSDAGHGTNQMQEATWGILCRKTGIAKLFHNHKSICLILFRGNRLPAPVYEERQISYLTLTAAKSALISDQNLASKKRNIQILSRISLPLFCNQMEIEPASANI